ncbi:MAG: cyclic nucleotide-binding domain-containing protein [Deltaproteobacteria bacterium]|nr:cyclic nucleotide-binding domain-containing protein [Deltaproteobacteria bacterium]
MSELQEKETGVEKALEAGDKESAVAGLYDLIVAYAKRKEFPKAEALRDRLFEVDPMALSEIVKSGEIIEAEKSEARDEGHMETFAALYGLLSTEEANDLYFALSSARFETDQPIFQEGDRNHRLYLVDQGEVKATHGEGEREVLLKTFGPGEPFGAETFFFRTAFSTFSAFTLTPVRASVLERSALDALKDDHPGLEAKLAEHCFRSGDMESVLKRHAMNRRKQKRVMLTGTLVAQIVGKDGKLMGKPFKGGFADISRGGLSFTVRVSKPETARLLLGRRLRIKSRLPLKGGKEDLEVTGRIIALQPHPFNEYSIHVRFEKALPEELPGRLDPSSSARSPDLDLKIET